MSRQPDRPAWHSLLLGFCIGMVLTALGVGFVLMLVACAAAGLILAIYEMRIDRSS